ncbi:MAG: hypothetical protein OSB41_05275 [Kiritimatiellae bacterium]|nr:hypothetical protein [Kiritimatiellia bacterium]
MGLIQPISRGFSKQAIDRAFAHDDTVFNDVCHTLAMTRLLFPGGANESNQEQRWWYRKRKTLNGGGEQLFVILKATRLS